MTAFDWTEGPLTKAHERGAFDCGEADLNLYMQRYARQNHDSGAPNASSHPRRKIRRVFLVFTP